MELDAFEADAREALRGEGLRAGDRERRVRRVPVEEPGRVGEQRLHRLDLDDHLGERVLHALEAPDRLPELDAGLRVVDGEREHRFGCADGLGHQRHRSAVAQALGRCERRTGRAEERLARNARPVEDEAPGAPGRVRELVRQDLDSGVTPLDHAEAVALRRAERDHEEIRVLCVGDEDLLATEREARSLGRAGERDPGRVRIVGALEQRQGPDGRSARELREPARALGRIAGALDRRRGEHRRYQGGRKERATRLLEHHREIDPAEPHAAVLVGEREAHPAELGHALPQVTREARRRLRELADLLERAVLVEELPQLGAQQLLFFRESEVHATLPPRQVRAG